MCHSTLSSVNYPTMMSTVATILIASVFGAVSVLFIIGLIQNERVL